LLSLSASSFVFLFLNSVKCCFCFPRNQWRAKWNVDGLSPWELVFQRLTRLQEEDPNHTVCVRYNPDSLEVNSIFFQTGQMKTDHKNFIEVLEMDTTYKLCTNNMPLVVFKVVDYYGSGRTVGFSLISSEKKEIVTEALKCLKVGVGEESASKIRTVLIDKDQSEIAAVHDVLPGTEVHLCDFHVKNAIEASGKKLAPNWKEIEPLIEKMRYAHTKVKYDKAYEELKKIAPKPFMDYFDKNWHNFSLIWSDYQRNETLNLRERTSVAAEIRLQSSQNATGICIVLCKLITLALKI